MNSYVSQTDNDTMDTTITSIGLPKQRTYEANRCSLFLRVALLALFQVVPCSHAYSGRSQASVFGHINKQQGHWNSQVYATSLVAAAAANLPDGDVLLWSAFKKDGFASRKGFTQTAVFHAKNHNYTTTETEVRHTNHDMFCPGTAMVADGSILISGGADAAHVTMYNADNQTWTAEPNLSTPRGYHTTTVLHDGSVLAMGGSWSGGLGDKHPEIWNPVTREWHLIAHPSLATNMLNTKDLDGVYRSDNHYWLFQSPVDPDVVIHAGPSTRVHTMNLRTGALQRMDQTRGTEDAMNGNAVMFDIGKLLTFGGAPNYDSGEAHQASYVMDLNDANDPIKINRVGDLNHARTFCSSAVLPSGEVVTFGGQSTVKLFSDEFAVRTTELWSPASGRWSIMASHTVPRNYHSVGLLLKDGRVMAAGGGLCGDKCGSNHADAEIFTPPYLFDTQGNLAPRPNITETGANGLFRPGDVMEVTVQPPEGERRNGLYTFALVRLSAVTHNINTDMRRIPLESIGYSLVTGNQLRFRIQVPGSASVVAPGNYFLFALNPKGVPSVAVTVRCQTTDLFAISAPVIANPSCDDTLPTDVDFQIVARHSGKAMRVAQGNVSDYANVVQWDVSKENMTSSSTWRLSATSGGYYQVIANHSGKALAVTGKRIFDVANAFQRVASGAINRQWCFVRNQGGDYYTIISRHSRKVLQVKKALQKNGASVQISDPILGDHQQWNLVRAPEMAKAVTTTPQPRLTSPQQSLNCTVFPAGSVVRIISRATGRALRVLGNSHNNGATVVQWKAGTRKSNNWSLVPSPVSQGYYFLIAQHSKKALMAKGGAERIGARIAQGKTSPKKTHMQWCFVRTSVIGTSTGDNDEEFFKVVSLTNNNLVIEAKITPFKDNGALVRIENGSSTGHANLRQEWTLEQV